MERSPSTPTRDLIVIGGSAGSIEALQLILGGLPPALPAAVLIVVHTHPTSPGQLARALEWRSGRPVVFAQDGEPLVHGRILVAPPDRHLLVEHDRVRLTRGPRENRSRPAIDPLFRSAAYFGGARVIGVVLSGMLDDGTAGLWMVKDRGGLAVVQSPEDAQIAAMPESALQHVAVDHRAAAHELGPLLTRLAGMPVPVPPQAAIAPLLAAETSIALGANGVEGNILQFGELSPFTCPECHGAMVQLRDGGKLRFRCHTGHAFSIDSLLAELSESVDMSLWQTLRGIQETGMLMRHLAGHLEAGGDSVAAARFNARAQDADGRAQQIKALVETEPV